MMDLSTGRVVNLPAALAQDPGNAEYEGAQEEITEAVLSRDAAKDGLRRAG